MTFGKTLKFNQGTEQQVQIKVNKDTTLSPEKNVIDMSETLSAKQDKINDLATIRTQAAHGEAAYNQLDGLAELLASI